MWNKFLKFIKKYDWFIGGLGIVPKKNTKEIRKDEVHRSISSL